MSQRVMRLRVIAHGDDVESQESRCRVTGFDQNKTAIWRRRHLQYPAYQLHTHAMQCNLHNWFGVQHDEHDPLFM